MRSWRWLGFLILSATAFGQNAREVFEKAVQALGDPGGVLHTRDIDAVEQNYQSAPPFITFFNSHESWFDPKTGVERIATESRVPGSPPFDRGTALNTRDGVYAVRDSAITRSPGVPGSGRKLNAWAVLADWRAATDVALGHETVFQGYPRTVLTHRGEFGEERLFLDPKTYLPVKLDREEPHYLWGQVHVEYEYLLWRRISGAMIPVSCARVVDGFKEISRTVGLAEWIDSGAAPSLAVPALPAPAGDATPLFLQPIEVKTVDVAPGTFLTTNPGYTEAFTRIGDTVYVLDATQGERRAEQDLAWVAKTFGRGFKLFVVVTDLAWPHVAGVRFWVAQGAAVVSHRESKDFLARVVAHRWTRAPDLLERRRSSAKFRFVPVDKSLDVGRGQLRLIAIDGIGSEGALMAWRPDQRFLWASDYIQSVTAPAAYTDEVCAAVKRSAISPERVAAQHIPLTPWSTVAKLCR